VSRFRNRLAHFEPIFRSRHGLDDRMNDLYEILAGIHPPLADWTKATSSVEELLQGRAPRELLDPFDESGPWHATSWSAKPEG
jgi:hypothetical protein